MRRALVLAVLLLAAPVDASASGGNGPCDQFHTVVRVLRCAAERWDVSPPELVSLARCESGLNPRAVNGRFVGLTQIGDTEWVTWAKPNRWREWWPEQPGRMNPRAHAIVAAFHVAHAGWSAWSGCR